MKKEEADNIISEYMNKIYGFALSKTMNIDTAEELAATITFEVYKSLLKSDCVHNINSYIYQIASNVYANFVTKENENKSIIQDATNSTKNAVDDEYIPLISENATDRDHAFSRIRKEISRLSKTQREIIVMYYFQNLKLSEIAKRLNLSHGVVRWHLFEARNKIKEGFLEDDDRAINSKPMTFTKISSHGIIGGFDIDTAFFFSKNINQDIAYLAYHKAKTAFEIAKELDIPFAFIEDKISRLVDNGFMNKLPKNKFRTNIYITEETKEKDAKIDEIYTKYAVEVCDIYIPLLFDVGDAFMRPFESQEPVPSLLRNDTSTHYPLSTNFYTPQNDFNFLMWSIISFACKTKLATIENERELENFMVCRQDWGKYYATASIRSDLDTKQISPPIDGSISKKKAGQISQKSFCNENLIWITDVPLYSITVWMFFTIFDNRVEKYSNWNIYLWENLYLFMTGRLTKESQNIDIFKNLFDKGLLVSAPKSKSKVSERQHKCVPTKANEYINMIVTTFSEKELIDLLPPIPEKLKIMSKQLDEEMYRLHKKDLPKHMHKMCRLLNQNHFISARFITHVIKNLLTKGTLKPLKKRQKMTVNSIMFCPKGDL